MQSVAIVGEAKPTARELSNCTCNDSLWPLRACFGVRKGNAGAEMLQMELRAPTAPTRFSTVTCWGDGAAQTLSDVSYTDAMPATSWQKLGAPVGTAQDVADWLSANETTSLANEIDWRSRLPVSLPTRQISRRGRASSRMAIG